MAETQAAAKPLTLTCRVGERVWWKTLGGDRHEGELVEWDSNVAVVRCDDGRTRAVEC